MNKKSIAIAVLASGKSERMGKNKLLLSHSNTYLFENILKTVSLIDVSKVVISCYKEILQTAKSFGIKTVYNNSNNLGFSHTIKLAVNFCERYDGTVFVPADQPFISSETLKDMIELFIQKNQIVSCVFENKRYPPTLFGSCYYKDLLKLKGDRGGKNIMLENIENVTNYYIKNEIEIFDVDTKDDYLKYLTFAASKN